MIEHMFWQALRCPTGVLELARRLEAAGFDADRLEGAWRREIRVFALEVADREAILRVLEDGPKRRRAPRNAAPGACMAAAGRPFAFSQRRWQLSSWRENPHLATVSGSVP